MPALCPAAAADAPLVRSLLDGVDCNVNGLAVEGYAVLARPDGPVLSVLTALLTLYVAFIGLRLLLGRGGLTVGEATVAVLKIGLVLVLATSWDAYQTVVYDALFRGPTDLAAHLLAAVQPAGSAFRGDPFAGLQAAHDVLTGTAGAYAGRAGAASPLLGGVAFSAAALNVAAFLMLMSTVGTLLAAKVVLAILLALAPVFAGLLLFDATRGALEGWLKAAVGFALVPLVTTLALAVELTVLEPHLVRLVQMRASGELEDGPAVTILVLCLVFAGVLTGLGVAGAVIAAGLRLPRSARPLAAPAEPSSSPSVSARAALTPGAVAVAATAPPSRASQAGAALIALDRRDARAQGATAADPGERRVAPALDRAAAAGATAEPLGRTWRRASGPRRSASSDRRDREGVRA